MFEICLQAHNSALGYSRGHRRRASRAGEGGCRRGVPPGRNSSRGSREHLRRLLLVQAKDGMVFIIKLPRSSLLLEAAAAAYMALVTSIKRLRKILPRQLATLWRSWAGWLLSRYPSNQAG